MRHAIGRRPATLVVTAAFLFACQLAPATATAHEAPVHEAEGAWDLVVCADPHAMPLSDRSEAGYENEIAHVLAEELGARLVFDFYPQMQDMIDLRLRGGHCDVVMGVPDGAEPLLTTIAYYTSPYVFVYRSDAGFEIDSLDDPDLTDLAIGLQNAGMPPHDSLISRGLGGNVAAEYGNTRYAPGDDPQARLVEAVLAGEVDVGVSWGPPAGYYAAQHPDELVVVPIEPAVDPNPPFTPLLLQMTMGVRQGDEALRDRLNLAIAARWDEIQAVLGRFSVPVVAGGPAPGGAISSGKRVIGYVAPSPSGALTLPQAALYDVVGASARSGAMLAEEEANREVAPLLDVAFANSPSPEAAERAARRLVVSGGAEALIGGLGAGQSEVLAAVAQELNVPFLNVAEDDARLRCGATYNIAPSGPMYAAAVAEWFGHESLRWYVVRQEGADWEAVTRAFRAAVGSGSSEVVGESVVAEAQPLYRSELDAATEAGADAIFLLVGASDQIAFLAQSSANEDDITIVPYPTEVTLSRDYLAAARQFGRAAGTLRFAPWETTLSEADAGELNERFTSRFGAPMDPLAWPAYAAVSLLAGALAETGDISHAALSDYLLGGEFQLAKDVPLSFDPSTRQLKQPIYVVRTVEGTEWGRNLSQQVGVAELVGAVPSDAARTSACG